MLRAPRFDAERLTTLGEEAGCAVTRRERRQCNAVSFGAEVLAFLRFAPRYAELAEAIAEERHRPRDPSAARSHGRSGSHRRARGAAVIAWMRHQSGVRPHKRSA